jgi:predicted AAA+ superfamily ATPase
LETTPFFKLDFLLDRIRPFLGKPVVKVITGMRRVGKSYLFDNIGNTMSAKSIADYLKSQRLRIGVDTVQNYLGYFTEAFVAHKVQRYDIKGKRLLEIHEKYYLNEIGIRHALLGYREADIGGLLENRV